MTDSLRRYAPIVDDLDAFLAAAERPVPRVVWVNTLLADPEPLAARVLAAAPDATPSPFWPHAWRVPHALKIGNWLPYRLGHLHLQEEASLLAAALLDAVPGDRVVDLCSAPGNKTAQIAVRMRDRGLILANDRSTGRLTAARHNLERLGVSCVVVTAGDARRVTPPATPPFDHALVDVPCTCEGTSRKDRSALGRHSADFRADVAAIQTGLLRKALDLVRPGGSVVYATCTYAPEENEAVLHAVDPEVADIVPFEVPPGARLAPGVLAWEGRSFRPDVVHAARFWPHHNDTGGFFIAKLVKRGVGGSHDPERRPLPGADGQPFVPLDEPARASFLATLDAHYGLSPARFDDHAFWMKPKTGSLWVSTRDAQPTSLGRVQSMGLRVRRGRKPAEQVSTPFLRRFGHAATRHVWELPDAAAVRAFFAYDLVQVGDAMPDGYYVARYRGQVLGRARVHEGGARAEIGKQDAGAVDI